MGKGSSKGHTPREAKDNLKSTQLLSVIDAISEGPIEGPVDGLKSVLLNSTPVLDSEGNANISGVTVVFRAGEQEQTPPEGFESTGSETVLGTEVKYDTPITRTITSANIDCVFRSIRSRIGIEVRSAIRIHSINRELNFFYRFLTRFFAAFHYRGIFPQ